MHFPKENAARRRLNCERTAADVVVRRRNRAPGGRPTNCMVALSEEEAALIREAAERDNMALGAYDQAVRLLRDDLLSERRRQRRGRNLRS
jgi:hypothetical protein